MDRAVRVGARQRVAGITMDSRRTLCANPWQGVNDATRIGGCELANFDPPATSWGRWRFILGDLWAIFLRAFVGIRIRVRLAKVPFTNHTSFVTTRFQDRRNIVLAAVAFLQFCSLHSYICNRVIFIFVASRRNRARCILSRKCRKSSKKITFKTNIIIYDVKLNVKY